MKKNKIGILSFYFHNSSYGGILQAFALQKILSSWGFDAEQICYKKQPVPGQKQIIRRNFFSRLKSHVKRKIDFIINKTVTDKLRKCRIKAIRQFEESIPHSCDIYEYKDTDRMKSKYDTFVCGSDQIWNPDYFNTYDLSVMCLSFTRKKIAYSASIGKQALNKDEELDFRKLLDDFENIAVREKSSAKMLEKILGRDIKTTLDPTFLLEESMWKSVESKRLGSNQYGFVFFLGEAKKIGHETAKFFNQVGMKEYIIPFLNDSNYLLDITGNRNIQRFYDVGPREFLSLIDNAEIIITNSFHAAVFSIIFNKQFLVCERKDMGISSMNSRLTDLLDTFGLSDRFIDIKCLQRTYESLKPIDYGSVNEILKIKRKDSIDFLKSSLKAMEDN